MLEGIKTIEENSCISDIVTNDYRTARVFNSYNINYCSGAKVPLKEICTAKDLPLHQILRELEDITYTAHPQALHDYQIWNPDFLADYIIHVHHRYLEKAIPDSMDYLNLVTEKYSEQYEYLPELRNLFGTFSAVIIPRQQQEEDIIFPYIRQIARAYLNKESYAALMVRTLRKPVEQVMLQEQKAITKLVREMRELTHNYLPPENACVRHVVALRKLRELDNDLVHHIHLENDVLYPRVLQMENELMNQKDEA